MLGEEVAIRPVAITHSQEGGSTESSEILVGEVGVLVGCDSAHGLVSFSGFGEAVDFVNWECEELGGASGPEFPLAVVLPRGAGLGVAALTASGSRCQIKRVRILVWSVLLKVYERGSIVASPGGTVEWFEVGGGLGGRK